MLKAKLTRGETASGYNYHLHIENEESTSKPKRLYHGRNYTHYIKHGGERIFVYFNKYVFPQFSEIPMIQVEDDNGTDCWEMEHEYRQVAGDSSAPYVIVGQEPAPTTFNCPLCDNEVEIEHGSDIERRDGKGTVKICTICESELYNAGIL